MIAVKDCVECLVFGLHCEGESVYAGGVGLGSEITLWVEWVTGDEALGPIVGADSELVSRAPTGRGAGFVCMSGLIVLCRKFGLYPSRIGCACCTTLT
jgi:hypothetical protein